MSERDYIKGERAAWRRILGEAERALGGREAKHASMVAELEATRAALRAVCEAHGDNDWRDDAYLPDVVEKHLGRHLGEKRRK